MNVNSNMIGVKLDFIYYDEIAYCFVIFFRFFIGFSKQLFYDKGKIFILYDYYKMIFALLLFGLLGAIMGVNIFGGLLRILMFFVMIALLWFIIKAGFYVLLFFAVFYFGIKGINYFVKLFGNLFADTNHKKYKRVPYGDAEIIEILE